MTTDAAPAGAIVAKPALGYRLKRIAMVVLLVGYGVFSLYDGFYRYPNWPKLHPNEVPKSQMDINLNRVLGCVLPPIGLILLVTGFWKSRGEYRLENDVLKVPGHPPVPLSNVVALDRQKWDRKGIAIIEYQTNGPARRITLDDYIYEREPTDRIFKRIEDSLVSASETPGENP